MSIRWTGMLACTALLGIVLAASSFTAEAAGKGKAVCDPTLRPFAAQFKINYPVLVGLGHDDLQNAFGPLVAFPTSFLIGRDGKVCTQHTGLAPREQFEREITALI